MHVNCVAVTHQVELVPLEVLAGDGLDAMKGLGARVGEVIHNLETCSAQRELHRSDSYHRITGRGNAKIQLHRPLDGLSAQ